MSPERARAAWFLVAILAFGLLLAPRASAQTNALYFPATGHHLTNTYGFLGFWEEHDGARLLGFPVTEERVIDSQVVQYFERGRVEQVVDPATGTVTIQTGAVGREYAEALWRTFKPAKATRPRASVQVFENGHTLRAPFLSYWEAGGGEAFFGAPISEPLWEMTEHGKRRVQYFERARLERDATMAGTNEEIVVADLGRALALLRGIDIAPVANWGAQVYGPPAPRAPDVAVLNPTPVPPTPTPILPTAVPAPIAAPAPAPAPTQAAAPLPIVATGSKSIVVNLTSQWLYAYEGDVQVFNAPVATGRDGMNTPPGSFSVYAKLSIQTMRGVDADGPWVVPDVPHVMYIHGDIALHGTYWHNWFGSGVRPSHGCINLPLTSAEWLYNWTPMGTTVTVTY